jgi:hypothetical protein
MGFEKVEVGKIARLFGNCLEEFYRETSQAFPSCGAAASY